MSQDGGRGRYAGRALANNRYQLRDLLGEGGMASVHLAHDSVLDRPVAIKTLHTELSREPAFRERFRREAQAVAKLTHTNIVSVFDTGEEELDGSTMPYIVMEYVEGRPLSAVFDEDVRQFGAMPADKALRITADVLAALEISHEMGLVHRDIKPGNVMMTKRGVVKVMDFGIARAMQSGVTSMTQTGMVVGTPQYLSPEQALGRAVDARSDLYSVGIMLFQLVTGQLPFDADSPLAIAYAHVQEEPPVPSSINRALPPAVDALVARALRKNPNERFPSAEAMRGECLRVASALQQTAPNIVSGERPRSGAGVASAVFPPVDQSGQAPAPGPVQQPYTPPAPAPQTPYPHAQTPHPQTPNPQTPHSQPPHAYQQPAPPMGYAYPHNGGYGPQTPAPYPAAGGRAGGRRRGRIVWTAVGTVAAVLVSLMIVGLLSGDDEDEPYDAKESPSASASVAVGHRGPDRSRTINPEKCTAPRESDEDPDKVQLPDFTYKDWNSVLSCLRAAGWKYKKNPVDENVYGEDTVMRQWPPKGTDVDPTDVSIEFYISTGDPA
jgi:serine/threonine protein kinase